MKLTDFNKIITEINLDEYSKIINKYIEKIARASYDDSQKVYTKA